MTIQRDTVCTVSMRYFSQDGGFIWMHGGTPTENMQSFLLTSRSSHIRTGPDTGSTSFPEFMLSRMRQRLAVLRKAETLQDILDGISDTITNVPDIWQTDYDTDLS